MTALEVRVVYEHATSRGGGTTTLFLGYVETVNAATTALRNAAAEVKQSDGRNMRVVIRRGNNIIFTSAVRGDGAACSS